MHRSRITVESEYKQRIDSLEFEINKRKKIDYGFSGLRLFIFLLMCYAIYLVIHTGNVNFAFLAFGLFVLFLFIINLNSTFLQKLKKAQTLKAINEQELECLRGKYDGFDEGNAYVDPKHSFSFDLDVFGKKSIFQLMNRTTLLEGADKLAHWFCNPLLEKQQIEDRQLAVKELCDLFEWRQAFLAVGKQNELDKERNVRELPSMIKNLRPIIFLLPVIMLTLIVLSLLSVVPLYLPIIMYLVQWFVAGLYSRKLNVSAFHLGTLSKQLFSYVELFKLVENQIFESSLLRRLKGDLFGSEVNSIKGLNKLKQILNTYDQRTNIIYILVGNGVFLIDLVLLWKVNQWYVKYGSEIEKWVNILAEINALNSMANFSYNNPDFCLPVFSEQYWLEADAIGHPLIDRGKNVKNDFQVSDVNDFNIVTGANMAGKSTFLRTVGINMVLASMGSVVCADRFEFQPVRLFTSMRTTDNLADDISYFHAELLRLKELISHIENSKNGDRYFIILDEILKGTNSKDKLIGSKLFMEKLLNYCVSGLVATHDLDLCYLSEKYPSNFKNICFEIEIIDNDVNYDYKLRNGITQNLNATFLLKKMGLV